MHLCIFDLFNILLSLLHAGALNIRVCVSAFLCEYMCFYGCVFGVGVCVLCGGV